MKAGRLNLRISEKRLAKLKAYAENKEKTVTQLIEDWVDRLPNREVGNSSSLREATPSTNIAD
jgi:predicted DNA-binding ribbon-helix-helix protein